MSSEPLPDLMKFLLFVQFLPQVLSFSDRPRYRQELYLSTQFHPQMLPSIVSDVAFDPTVFANA